MDAVLTPEPRVSTYHPYDGQVLPGERQDFANDSAHIGLTSSGS